jgi:hypothetical protein
MLYQTRKKCAEVLVLHQIYYFIHFSSGHLHSDFLGKRGLFLNVVEVHTLHMLVALADEQMLRLVDAAHALAR